MPYFFDLRIEPLLSENGVIPMFCEAKIPTPTGIAPRSSISGTIETKKEIRSALLIGKL